MRENMRWLIALLYISATVRCDVNTTNNGVLVSEIYPDLNSTNLIENDETGSVQEPPVTEENVIPDVGVISTKYGDIRGYEMTDTEMWQFLDIPYAAFNLDDPFQEPTEPEPWESVREIIEHSSRCPQLDPDDIYTGSNECLTLSVFVSHEANNSDVLFHIYDGDYIQGSGDPRRYGPGYLVPKDLILVLPNYRVGPLGFLCLQNNVAPGNAALKDLTMALKWTRENIALFGGNPLNIVVSGSGTAAALAEYLALSPKSQMYVTKVITESGSVLSHWAIDRNPLQTATTLLSRLNKTDSDIAEHTNVFNNTSLETIVYAGKGLVFTPCIDHDFINGTPWNLLRDQKLNQTFMLGATDRPGLGKAMQHTDDSVSALNQDFRLLLPNDLKFEETEQEKETGKRIKIQYFGNDTITLEHQNELSLCYTDCSYLSPGIRTARLLSAANATVFIYEFSFVSSAINTSELIYGAAGGDSLNYVFQRDEHRHAEGSVEYNITNFMTNLWVSFIHTGKPTADGVEWEEFQQTDESEEKWLSIGNAIELNQGYHPDRLGLWTEIYNEHFIDGSGATRSGLALAACSVVLIGIVNNL